MSKEKGEGRVVMRDSRELESEEGEERKEGEAASAHCRAFH